MIFYGARKIAHANTRKHVAHLSVGSIVQNGKFSAGTDILQSRLKNVDLPTFGIPTMPALRFVPGLLGTLGFFVCLFE